MCSASFHSGSELEVVSRWMSRTTSSCFGSSPGDTTVREMGVTSLLVPIILFHCFLPVSRLIVGQTTCFGISQAPGTSVSRGVRRNALVKASERQYVEWTPLTIWCQRVTFDVLAVAFKPLPIHGGIERIKVPRLALALSCSIARRARVERRSAS